MTCRTLNSRLHHRCATHLPVAAQTACDVVEQPRQAIVGFHLQALSPLDPAARISRQALLLSRVGGLGDIVLGEAWALEARYIVRPAAKATGWRDSITCFLLLRLTRSHCSPAALRRLIQDRAADLATLLDSVLPEYQFIPVERLAELRQVLAPFPVRDTVEVRRRTVRDLGGGGSSTLSLPWQGAVEVESILDLMLHQPAPTALAFCLAPGPKPSEPRLVHHSKQVPPSPVPSDGMDDYEQVPAWLQAPLGHVPEHLFTAESSNPPTPLQATAAYQEAWQQQWQVRQSLALEMASFHLRIQISGAARISDPLIATLTREVGGPGRLTAAAAWQAPMLPVAGGAVWARPRSARTRGQRQSEFAIACANLATLDFVPWGEPGFLAHLGEVACAFALPDVGQWLPQQSVAQALPFHALMPEGLRLGVNRVHGVEREVRQPLPSRHHHLWIVGQTGTGKSTLLETMVLQDILNGRGVIVIDPHGDLITQVLGKIPRERTQDVILFDPADKMRPCGLNPLETSSEDEQDLLVNAFIDLLIKLYDPYHTGIIGPRFEHGARNVMLTVMSTPGNTLVEVLRAFQDDAFAMKTLLPNVADPLVRRYWTDQISQTNSYHRSEVLDWLVSKFSHFVTDRTMRRILGQSTSSFSFREAMDTGKIVLLSLAKGVLGSENSTFLGLILLPMILRAALSRAEVPPDQRRDVSLVVDEFHNYATDSLALMLAEARKYHVGLTLANQHAGQLTAEIRDAVLGNVGSTLAFRLGAADAQTMEAMLAPSPISAHHLVTLPNFTAYGRLLVGAQRTPVFTLETEPSPIAYDEERAQAIREHSRMRYGRPREEVNAEIARRSNL